MNTIRPFLSAAQAAAEPTRPFGSTLATVTTGPTPAPWLPSGSKAAAPAPSAPPVTIDHDALAAMEAEACERGREEGLAETAELRDQLQKAIAAFTSARAALVAPTAMKIASAAVAVIGAWTETAPPAELYAPIIHAWMAKHDGPATAHVAPQHLEALKEIVANAPITVVPDATLRTGDLRLSSPTMEIAHGWDARLGDLRDAIANALEQS